MSDVDACDSKIEIIHRLNALMRKPNLIKESAMSIDSAQWIEGEIPCFNRTFAEIHALILEF
ncbi:MAG: hypothetical protein H0W50_04215 [Parachlamydiaceae bacterium]|nr:hypothetical protein [Parachlamydiaceae bacterium]